MTVLALWPLYETRLLRSSIGPKNLDLLQLLKNTKSPYKPPSLERKLTTGDPMAGSTHDRLVLAYTTISKTVRTSWFFA